MNTPDKCPHCGAEQEISFNIYGWKCGTIEEVQTELCQERAAHAATKRELEEYRKENDVLRALLPKLGVPCVYCGLTEIGKCERGFPGCAQADDLMVGDEAMHGDVLKRLRSSEARVRELEGLAIGNQESGDGGLWVEVFIPIERLGGANCEGEECPTLGDAMPRKEEA